jgi:RNA polymerase sigma-70 factor (ECF subfamily)
MAMDFTTQITLDAADDLRGPSARVTTESAADQELIEGLRCGSGQAFERLVREQGPRMLATARRLLRCEHDAHDAVQDALLSAYRNVHTFTGASRLSTWLNRVVINASLMRRRSRRRFEREESLPDGLLPQFDADGRHALAVPPWRDEPSNGDASSLAAAAELRARVRSCIDELPDAYRTVVLIRDIEGLDTAEAAATLGCSEGNVKTRLHRARQALRTLLKRRLSHDAVLC